jgi:hypothetical protein
MTIHMVVVVAKNNGGATPLKFIVLYTTTRSENGLER